MRRVFNNHEIPHLWAHQTQNHARNGKGSFYFSGPTIYSYGSHFPIATHVKGFQGQPGILFTTEKNSVTTSQHASTVSRAIPPDVPVFHVPCQHFGFSKSEDDYRHTKNFKHYAQEIAELISSCARARTSYVKEWKHDRAVELRSEALCYATFFGLPDPAIDQVPDLDSAQMAAIKSREAKASAEKAAKSRREAEEKRQRALFLADEWRAGGGHHYLLNIIPTMLRLEGSDVVTSRGARFPISHAKRALTLIRAVINRAEEWRGNGHSCHLGHYSIDRIEANGTVHAGCHVVSWDEIERIAPFVEAFQAKEVPA